MLIESIDLLNVYGGALGRVGNYLIKGYFGFFEKFRKNFFVEIGGVYVRIF